MAKKERKLKMVTRRITAESMTSIHQCRVKCVAGLVVESATDIGNRALNETGRDQQSRVAKLSSLVAGLAVEIGRLIEVEPPENSEPE